MYKLFQDTVFGPTQAIMRVSDKSSIPFDPANIDYQEYLKWVEAGNTPEPADE